jgi:hypothetical protein
MLPRRKDGVKSFAEPPLVRCHRYPLCLPPHVRGTHFGFDGGFVSSEVGLSYLSCFSPSTVSVFLLFLGRHGGD